MDDWITRSAMPLRGTAPPSPAPPIHHPALRPALPRRRSVFPAPAGGPVAALRDDSKLVLYVGAAAQPDIQLYSAAGGPLGRVLWEPRARVAAAGWTSQEQLLVLDDATQVGRAGCMWGVHGRWVHALVYAHGWPLA